MSIKMAVIVAFVMVASLSVAGCTVSLPSTSSETPTPSLYPTPSIYYPTPNSTPTPISTITPISTATPISVDYSAYYNKRWESGNGIVERPFTKSTNVRGNDVYKGIVRNTSQPTSKSETIVIELTESIYETQPLYNSYIAQKLAEGYSVRSDRIAQWESENSAVLGIHEAWFGQLGAQQFVVFYLHNSYIPSWELTTQAV
jgi:hypothetical protein